MSRRVQARAGAVALVVALVAVLAGGCVTVQDEAGGAPVLVPVKEKEKLGYERPEGARNPELQRRAMRFRDQIFAVVQPHSERMLGREVEMTGIHAIYPYSSVEVGYRTVDEPVVVGSEFVALRRDGSLRSASSIGESAVVVGAETVSGLYPMAYRAEVAAMREYLATAFPEFTGLPRGYMDALGVPDPQLEFRYFDFTYEESSRRNKLRETIYEAYRVDPDRTDAQWREVFEDAGARSGVLVGVRLVLRDPAVELTEERARAVADAIRSHAQFEPYPTLLVRISSGTMMRDRSDFHDTWTFKQRTGVPGWWLVERTLDGGTVR